MSRYPSVAVRLSTIHSVLAPSLLRSSINLHSAFVIFIRYCTKSERTSTNFLSNSILLSFSSSTLSRHISLIDYNSFSISSILLTQASLAGSISQQYFSKWYLPLHRAHSYSSHSEIPCPTLLHPKHWFKIKYPLWTARVARVQMRAAVAQAETMARKDMVVW